MSTLHRPESVRVKIGCRNVDDIPPVAESVLGDQFYDFTYEIDQVLVRDLIGRKAKSRLRLVKENPLQKSRNLWKLLTALLAVHLMIRLILGEQILLGNNV